MVELGRQYALLVFRPLTLADINIDANYPLRLTIAAVGNEATRLDPLHATSRANDPIRNVVFAQPLAESLCPDPLYSIKVLWMRPRPPFGSGRLHGALGQSVESCIALIDLHPVCVDIIRIATDQGCLSGQCQLQVALSQGQPSSLALANVSHDLRGADDLPCRVFQR